MRARLTRDSIERFQDTYQRIVRLWPESVDVPASSSLGAESSCFGHLVTVYYQVEDQILRSRMDDDWLRIMNWSIYQICHQYVLGNGAKSIRIPSLSLNEIETVFTTNLSDPNWTDLKGAVEQFARGTHLGINPSF